MIQETAKVMQNNTICIPKSIREKLCLKEKDSVILTLNGNKVGFRKAPSSWLELAQKSPKIFKKYGGGEAYLKKERADWYE